MYDGGEASWRRQPAACHKKTLNRQCTSTYIAIEYLLYMSLFGKANEPSIADCLLCGGEVTERDETRKLVLERTDDWVLKHRTDGELCSGCWTGLTETIIARKQDA